MASVEYLLSEKKEQLCRGFRNSSSKISHSNGRGRLSRASLFICNAGNCVMAGLWDQRREQVFLGVAMRAFWKEVFGIPFKNNSTDT